MSPEQVLQHQLQVCFVPLAMEYWGMSLQEVLEKIRTTDLRETCGYVDINKSITVM